jgi:hypothetical protein
VVYKNREYYPNSSSNISTRIFQTIFYPTPAPTLACTSIISTLTRLHSFSISRPVLQISSSMKYQTILSTMLMIPILASARIVPRASNSSDTMQLTCTTGFQAIDCLSFYGTSCSAEGVVQNPGTIPTDGDCTSKHCTCTGNAAVAAPPGNMTTVPSDSACATVTMTVTITHHHRANNGSCTFSHTGSFTRYHNETATHHHHKSNSSTSVMTQTPPVNPLFTLTVVPRTTISSIPLISLTGNLVLPPSASSPTV